MANENNIVPRLKVRVLTQSGTLRVKMPNMPNRLGVDIPLLKSVTTDAVLYVPQELNESEQSVARNNVGITDEMYHKIENIGTVYHFEDGLVKDDNDTVRILIDPTSQKDTEGNDLLTVSQDGLKFSGSTLSAEQKAAVDWAIEKRQEDLQEEADALFTVDTTVSGSSYWADVNTTTTMTVTVTVKFDNVKVVPKNDTDIQNNGWTCVEDGVYTKSVSGASGTVSVQTFIYQVQSGDYTGITCTKNSAQKSISVNYPVYYGWATDKNISDILWNNNKFVRSESAIGTAVALQDISINNNTGGNAYFFVLTRSNTPVQVKQSGNPVIDPVIPNQSFTSTESVLITMSGYNLYFTSENFADGKTPKFSVYIPK